MSRGGSPALQPLLGRPVRELMRSRYISVSPEETLYAAESLMRMGRVRHLPVIRDGRLVGILSHRDILEASIARLEDCLPQERAGHLRAIAVERMMHHAPETVTPNCPLAEVAARMFQLKIGCLPVVERADGGVRMLGLVTESDLLRAAYDPGFGWDPGD